MIKLAESTIRRVLPPVSAIAFLGLVLTFRLPSQNQADFNETEVIASEDLSESLANALLDFSAALRDGDLTTLAPFFAEDVETVTFPFPSAAGGERVKWINVHSLDESGDRTVSRTREKFIDDLRTWLESFSQMEDARFKVTDTKSWRPETAYIGADRMDVSQMSPTRWVLLWRDGPGAVFSSTLTTTAGRIFILPMVLSAASQ